jgi:hypothetical protein
MPKDAPSDADRNLGLAVIGLLIASGAASLFTAWIACYVLESFASSQTMALLITDAGVRSDDARLEGQLTDATKALIACRDVATALGVGCGGVGLALVWRRVKRKAPQG